MDLNLAVLIDFDNIAKGTQEDGLGDFDARVIMRRLKDKGRILVARAYCDWDRWPKKHRSALLEQGVTMVELTSHAGSNKNRGDIALAVDAMEIAYTREYIDAFVVVSGDSDFTPLVMRLKELNRRVIGIGTRRATSRLIANLCDEFLFYDTLLAPAAEEPGEAGEPLSRNASFALLVETLVNHQRDEAGPVASGVLKQAMKRKVPAFSEADLGFASFGKFLEKAQEKGRIILVRDERGGGWRVDLPNAAAEPVTVAVAPPAENTGGGSDPVTHALANAGIDLASPEVRRALAQAFVEVCQERAAKDRKCAVQFVIGDLLNRRLPVRAEEVRGFVNSLFHAGVLLHADGDSVRKPTSPFVPPESAEGLLAALDAKVSQVLRETGVAAPEQVEPEASAPSRDEGEGEGRRRRKRGGRRGRGGRGESYEGEAFEGAEDAAVNELLAEEDKNPLAEPVLPEEALAAAPEAAPAEAAPERKPRIRKRREDTAEVVARAPVAEPVAEPVVVAPRVRKSSIVPMEADTVVEAAPAVEPADEAPATKTTRSRRPRRKEDPS